METMINLSDLLKHEILDLYSAEEQIIDALPAMIDKAKNPELKKALQEHLRITEEQKTRLDKVKQTFGEGDAKEGENKGFFSRLFGGGSVGEKCRGMEGLITEGQKIMKADITEEALDAAIIASAQKIEHYEICGYGTARAFARELKLAEVEQLLTQTLNEEYEADDRLTSLAVGKLNIEAEITNGMSGDGSDNSDGSSRTVRTVRSTNGNGSSPKGAARSSSSNGSSRTGKSSVNGTSKTSLSTKTKASKNNSKNLSKGAKSKAIKKTNKGSVSKGSSLKSNSSKSSSPKSSSSRTGSSKPGTRNLSKSSSSKSATKVRGKSSSKMKRATSGGQRQRKGK